MTHVDSPDDPAANGCCGALRYRPAILLVDDDAQLARMLAEFLSGEGYAAHRAESGAAAFVMLAERRFDLVILDVMMPNLSGLEVLRRLRDSNDVPVLMLTARGEDSDRITGLELGADDYLSKPFNPRELVARIRAILRRMDRSGSASRPRVTVGPLTLGPSDMSVAMDQRAVRLTAAEFLVLERLARGAGQIQTRAELTREALGRPLEAYDRSIDTHVSNVRRKLGLAPGGPLEIRSLRGRGYLLIAAGQA
jgi:DNA-binding response OmpR family regulator